MYLKCKFLLIKFYKYDTLVHPLKNMRFTFVYLKCIFISIKAYKYVTLQNHKTRIYICVLEKYIYIHKMLKKYVTLKNHYKIIAQLNKKEYIVVYGSFSYFKNYSLTVITFYLKFVTFVWAINSYILPQFNWHHLHRFLYLRYFRTEFVIDFSFMSNYSLICRIKDKYI